VCANIPVWSLFFLFFLNCYKKRRYWDFPIFYMTESNNTRLSTSLNLLSETVKKDIGI